MTTNTTPIYSGAGDIQGGDLLTTAALLDYSGTNANNTVTFTSNGTYGGYIQKIRFKAAGTNAATVARIYINNGNSRLASSVAAVTGTPAGSLITTGGNLMTGSTGANYFAKIVALDQYGGITAPSLETASVSNVTTGLSGSITWTWGNVVGAKSYRIYVGPVTNGQLSYFTANASPFVQTEPVGTRESITGTTPTNNYLYGEISLPATTATATAATVDIDYPMNFALGPGQRVVVGLASNVVAGWYITGFGGTYATIP